MAIYAISVDQRVIDIDSRRFASIEKALVELITNSDDSYTRLEETNTQVTGQIFIKYERHQRSALLVVTDQAEGMSFGQVCSVLSYGAAHSPLARGEGSGRGYFGRGLKQAIYGLGHGLIETIHAGRFSRIELFRSKNGAYMYDDGGGDRSAKAEDYVRLGVSDCGTQVTIVVENMHVNISHFRSIVQAAADNIYLRDVLTRRNVELINVQQGKEIERSGQVHYEEPPAIVLLGPDQVGHFVYEQKAYPFILTLKRALDVELKLMGDDRTNGLVILSGTAVLDCQLFEYENQVGTEYLFGTVRCPALIEKLGQGTAIISDEREGLNRTNAFVTAFSQAVSEMIAPCVLAEKEKLKHLEHATTSDRTSYMIEHMLQRMNQAAIQDLGIILPPYMETAAVDGTEYPDILRFTTPFYYRELNHPFHVTLLIDSVQFAGDEVLDFDYTLPDSMHIEPTPTAISVSELNDRRRIEWTVVGEAAGDRGEIIARAGNYWALCEIVVAEHASRHSSYGAPGHAVRRRLPRDHGIDMFVGYDFRNLGNELDRAVYSPEERKILINTGAPTVQLYVDGRGHFRDSARLLLAELLMDVISDELARCLIEKSGHKDNIEAYHAAKMDIIFRYGNDIHLSFLNP
jgi:hypothetical protein